MRTLLTISLFALAASGCGDAKTASAPLGPMQQANGAPIDATAPTTNGAGENPFGPARADADKKIAEIKANASLSDDLKKQLIDEVERTYKAAQGGVGRK
jgi:hypothetical protein